MAKKEKITSRSLISSKQSKKKIAMLTAYDSLMASVLDESGIDVILVGDSLGDVMLGYRNTLPVTMTEMIIHVQAVSRVVTHALVVADMPFGSFQHDSDLAVKNAIDLVKAGGEAVKVEGVGYVETIKQIIKAGIPVMGHLGFTPQSVNLLGYKIHGRDKKGGNKLLKEAKTLEKAGCFAIVLELVDPETAKKISKALKIPVIGIGSGDSCDGQVLVTYDMLGMYPNPPGFVKKYANLREVIKLAVKKYIGEIKCKL
ncbi:3-methyl-2-oxobutanoate hydroxymethyltransferase [candidate division WOR-1 bacterium RIFOXYD2_FULL_36_8]|uniref:3-methyl-2-oxobutanoate hydroxymethyltransferase n=1 Tax=candidate division WOR-1 bacterium RIFOXYB2_FULL_36_35 TaxID=1802578 RepID=A0A1F4S6S9_UNCSA|nr:MAG: 3-methyl-2-oxobutanoate hydroxymethyltransferase [candidate division WOR-1 bacterium RIFOXYA2_FULL_36_21]OGC16142.1 MAG: 3-methyl-2-oxobutanoate hydroxymethyltransferase [candidate division WOR-1 bacterium RIFOXYB2_FULL_36_35]OGC16943.1 MAG: 3-methyl-2-oxobutanoate hydroxymethyltransferase [candidate division WOR-1 bacterium RIFOXYA12_FULL_36_13]OGC38707.1 MAG: 3-methyl-2-oxobutanoate hydroxymethyltransferase [candidate division WOR-1 bacterium RIFOXYD2_FULL_36_8]